jgi:Mg2+ and Co2+ transporter CorA
MCPERTREVTSIATSERGSRRSASPTRTSSRSSNRATAPSRPTRAGRRATPATETRPSAPGDPDRLRIRLFDADRQDHHVDWHTALAKRPSGRQLLWIDITGELSSAEAEELCERFDLDDRAREALTKPAAEPHLALHGRFVHLRVAAEPGDKRPERAPWLDILAGPDLVITGHEQPLAFLAGMDDRIERDTTLGLLHSTQFVASLLDSVLTTYYQAIDAIEDEADELDGVALRDKGRRELLEDLVAVRQRIGRLRRLLASERDVFASLAEADFTEVAGDKESAPAFQAVAARFEAAFSTVGSAREAILGSFDIYMTRTAQRTNDVMKVLALATVLLLPGSLIAGLLGMNVIVPLDKDSPVSFWFVVGGVVLLAVTLLVIARVRRWL